MASGVGVGEEGESTRPVEVAALAGRGLVDVSSAKHSLFLLDSGVVLSCGANNDFGQIGRESGLGIPRAIASLDAFVVTSVATGDDYSVVTTNTGSVFSWGKNHMGQLGHGNKVSCSKPKLVKGLISSKVVVKVCAGRSHTLMLCRTGELFGCGDGSIGNGDVLGSSLPSPILHTYGSPIISITAGEQHSMLLTNGGVVWSWGANSFGQLGLGGGSETIFRPNVVKTLLGARAVQIACGSFHSLVTTDEGRVFSWGKAADGQLGHAGLSSASLSQPRIVSELLGTRIVCVAGGRRHSVFLDDQNRVFVSGNTAGVANAVPAVVETLAGASRVFAGPFSTFLSYSPGHIVSPRKRQNGVFFLDDDKLRFVESLDASNVNVNTRAELSTLAETGFSFPGSVNGSFLDSQSFFATNDTDTPGIDAERAYRFMEKLQALGAGEAMANAWSRLIRNSLDAVSSKSCENMRVYLLAFFNPHMLRPDSYFPVIDRFLVSVLGLRPRPKRILMNWLASSNDFVFGHVVQVIQTYLAFTSSQHHLKQKTTTGALLLDELRNSRRHVPPSFFYNSALSRNLDLVHEYANFRQGPSVFSWLRYAFVLDPAAKAALVGIAFKSAVGFATVLAVRRSHLLEDAMAQIHGMTNAQLRQPIKVVFLGEQGLDEGGPTRELFQLLLEQILNPDFGLFSYNATSGKYWFAADGENAGSSVVFELIGVLVGLAIANQVILNLRFPSVLYEKLLGISAMTTEQRLERLSAVDPELAKGLSDVLAMEFENVEQLGLSFSVTRNNLGLSRSVDLMPGGDDVPVTGANARKYVDMYADFVLHTEVAASYRAFQSGFARVVENNSVISLLNAS